MQNQYMLIVIWNLPGLAEKAINGQCASEPMCPHPCRCADGIVDCREKGLTKVPDHLPDGTTELYVSVLLSN